MFEQARSDPNVKFVGTETWDGGQKVYILQSKRPINVFSGNNMQHPTGLVTLYFDTKTYEMLGNQVTIEKDGKTTLVSSLRVLTEEILPAGMAINWDLSDLQNASIVDDPGGEHALLEIITRQDLVSETESFYLLKTVPQGYSLEIGRLPNRNPKEAKHFEATYRDDAGNVFTIMSWGQPIQDAPWADETYTTVSGLVMFFVEEAGVSPSGGQWTSALVNTLEEMSFGVTSNFPREVIKDWAENLVIAK